MGIKFDYLLLQILVITFPLIAIQVLYLKHNNLLRYKKGIWGILCFISGFLCLSYSLPMGDGTFIDLRIVPLFVAFLYGGIVSGFSLTASLLLYRFVIGGIGFYISLFVIFLLAPIIYWVLQNYSKFCMFNKIKYGFVVVSIPIFVDLFMTILLENITVIHITTWFLTLISCFFSISIIIYFMESVDQFILYNEEISKAKKLELVGQLAAGIAHEVRNPLTSVRGFLQLLCKSTNISESEKTFIELSIEEVDRANLIIDEYLSLAKTGDKTDNVRLFNIQQEINYVINSINSFAIINNVKLNCTSNVNNQAFVKGNNCKFKQVLINIIKNAIEAIDKKQNGVVIITTYDTEKYITIEIEDNGIGMTKNQLSSLKEPFFSTKENGTGLGMMICYNIIDSMNGKITVYSMLGEGTKFSIILPKFIDSE